MRSTVVLYALLLTSKLYGISISGDLNMPQPGFDVTGSLSSDPRFRYTEGITEVFFNIWANPVTADSSVTITVHGDYWLIHAVITESPYVFYLGNTLYHRASIFYSGYVQHTSALYPTQAPEGPVLDFSGAAVPGRGVSRTHLGPASHDAGDYYRDDWAQILVAVEPADLEPVRWNAQFHLFEVPEPATWSYCIGFLVLVLVSRRGLTPGFYRRP